MYTLFTALKHYCIFIETIIVIFTLVSDAHIVAESISYGASIRVRGLPMTVKILNLDHGILYRN